MIILLRADRRIVTWLVDCSGGSNVWPQSTGQAPVRALPFPLACSPLARWQGCIRAVFTGWQIRPTPLTQSCIIMLSGCLPPAGHPASHTKLLQLETPLFEWVEWLKQFAVIGQSSLLFLLLPETQKLSIYRSVRPPFLICTNSLHVDTCEINKKTLLFGRKWSFDLFLLRYHHRQVY